MKIEKEQGPPAQLLAMGAEKGKYQGSEKKDTPQMALLNASRK